MDTELLLMTFLCPRDLKEKLTLAAWTKLSCKVYGYIHSIPMQWACINSISFTK